MNDSYTPGDDGGSISDAVDWPDPTSDSNETHDFAVQAAVQLEQLEKAKLERGRLHAIAGSIVVFTLAIAGVLYSLAWQASLVWIALVAIVAAIELTND